MKAGLQAERAQVEGSFLPSWPRTQAMAALTPSRLPPAVLRGSRRSMGSAKRPPCGGASRRRWPGPDLREGQSSDEAAEAVQRISSGVERGRRPQGAPAFSTANAGTAAPSVPPPRSLAASRCFCPIHPCWWSY